MRRLSIVLLGVLVGLLGAGACGSDEAPTAAPSTDTTLGAGEPGPSVVTTGTTQPPSNQAVATAELTTMWGCGYGFAVSDPEQTVGVVLSRATAIEDDGPATVVFPDPNWDAEVRLGQDLFANWCDDTYVVGEPTPRVDETWTVIGGTLVATVPPIGGCGGLEATATVTDLSVVAPNGSTITFAPLTLTNDLWGCSAG